MHALLVAWDGRTFDEHTWPKAGAFPMLPFANRLPRAGLCIAGQTVRPRPGPNGTAMHGFAHRRAWSVTDACPDKAVLAFVHRAGDEAWPWAWSATQEVCLGDAGLHVSIRVRNDSPGPMPLTIGWHPYHPLPCGETSVDLSHDAACRFDLDEEGRAQGNALPPAFDLEGGETAAFAPWGGRLHLRIPDIGTIRVNAKAADALVLHRPAGGGDYLCAEPVTSLPGAMTLLESGAERRLDWSCSFEPEAGVA